jgi:FKBP-type peptidyl-prolyl cis-trans isomerase
MKISTSAILCVLGFGLLATGVAPAQKSGSGKLPEAPAAKSQASTSTSASSPSAFKDEKEKVSYALGVFLASRVRSQAADLDANTVAQALKEALTGGKTLISDDDALATLNQWQKDRIAKETQSNLQQGQAFLAENKKKEGIVALPSGLQYKIVTPGAGPKPTASDTVVCNYKGTLINGTVFDSSEKHGHPLTFPVSGVIKGWTEALQLMPVGSKWQLFIPPDLAYGERGAGADIPPNSTLVFEVELVSIQTKEPVPPAPVPQTDIPSSKPATPPSK